MTYTAAVKGGFWPEHSVSSLTSAGNRSAIRRAIAMRFGTRAMRVQRELLTTLLADSTPASTASETIARVAQPSDNDLSGVRTIETETQVSRAVVAGDVTDIDADFLAHGGVNGSFPSAMGNDNPLGSPGLA